MIGIVNRSFNWHVVHLTMNERTVIYDLRLDTPQLCRRIKTLKYIIAKSGVSVEPSAAADGPLMKTGRPSVRLSNAADHLITRDIQLKADYDRFVWCT